jgi:hypothetical protein
MPDKRNPGHSTIDALSDLRQLPVPCQNRGFPLAGILPLRFAHQAKIHSRVTGAGIFVFAALKRKSFGLKGHET